MSLSSIPYFNFDIPVVSDLRGRFVYHYFTPGETIYPGNDDATLEDRTGSAFGFPRKIVLELQESLDDIADSDVIVDPRIVQERIINASNVSKAVTEGQAQSRNASRLSFNIGMQKLGGRVLELSSKQIGFDDIRESPKDILNVLAQANINISAAAFEAEYGERGLYKESSTEEDSSIVNEPKTSSVETWWNLSTPYFNERFNKFNVPNTFVSAKIFGFSIELSTWDSAAKWITPLGLNSLNMFSNLILSLISQFIKW